MVHSVLDTMEGYERTMMIVRVILSIILLGLLYFVYTKAKQNRENANTPVQPAIAGQDILEGGAKNPEQFDEPDEEALEMMGDLLGENEED